MKKVMFFAFVTFCAVMLQSAGAMAQIASVEDNYRQIRSLSCRFDSVVFNSKGRVESKSRLILDGENRRLDCVSPDRMAFMFFRDSYSVYSYQDKKMVVKKLSELSDAHRIFTEELFWTILYDPFKIFYERFLPLLPSERSVAKSPVTMMSRRDPDSRVVISFAGPIITSAEYYTKNQLTKRITMSDPVESNGVRIPSRADIRIFSSGREMMRIQLSVSEIEINKTVPEKVFTRVDQ